MPTDTDLHPDKTESGPEHGSGDPVQGAGAQGGYRPRNIGKSHPAGPSAVDTMVDNPAHGKELRSKRQKALSPEECRETATVERKFSRRQVRDKVTFELDEASVKEPRAKFRYDKHPKTSAEMKELPHTLQESGVVGSHKKVYGRLRSQAKNKFYTAPVPCSSQSMKVPLEVSPILTEKTEMLHGTPECLDNVHRQLKQSNLESSGVTVEVKTRRGATEGDPKVAVKHVANTVNDIRNFSVTGNEIPQTSHREFEVSAETETRFGATQGKLNVNEPDRLPTPNHLVSLIIGLLTKCDKLINICRKFCNFSGTENAMPEILLREIVMFAAEKETTFGARYEQLNINDPVTARIPKHLVSLAMDVLTKCEKLAKMCREITDVFPDRLPARIMTNSHPLQSRIFFMLADISFSIIKLFSELISALMSLIYIIIHADYMFIVPENIIPSLDPLMVALFNVEMKYKILCTRYILRLNILTPEEHNETLQNDQTESIPTDVPGEDTKMSSQLLETLYEQDETCSLALSEVPRCRLTLLEKDSVKMRLTVIGVKLGFIGEKLLPLTAPK